MSMARNDAFRVKTNAEMLSEILPAITARAAVLKAAGKPMLADPSIQADLSLARHFGASVFQVASALRAGRGV